MGFTRWDDQDWKQHSSSVKAKPTAAIFTSSKLHPDLDPKSVNCRESRDSVLNPNSNAIIVAVDVTGSMGMISDYMVKTGLGVLFQEILDRQPVSDPHLMVMAVGDLHCDAAPFQVSQFEADTAIIKQLEKIYLEGNGGGNGSESYHAPLYFAANHTSIDCFEKRGKKGYLFTIGDEGVPPPITSSQLEKHLGKQLGTGKLSYEELLASAEKMYEVYHIIIAQGGHASYYPAQTKEAWKEVLGERAIWLDDYTKLSEVIVSIIQMNEGSSYDSVISSWSGDTSLTVASATKDLKQRTGGVTAINASPKVVMF